MNEKELSDRFFDFSICIIEIIKFKKKNFEITHVKKQLFRSGTSCGANYEEAICAESRRDFIHKLHVVLKELRETKYWLRILQYLNKEILNYDSVIEECTELIKIISTSIKTAKTNLIGSKVKEKVEDFIED